MKKKITTALVALTFALNTQVAYAITPEIAVINFDTEEVEAITDETTDDDSTEDTTEDETTEDETNEDDTTEEDTTEDDTTEDDTTEEDTTEDDTTEDDTTEDEVEEDEVETEEENEVITTPLEAVKVAYTGDTLPSGSYICVIAVNSDPTAFENSDIITTTGLSSNITFTFSGMTKIATTDTVYFSIYELIDGNKSSTVTATSDIISAETNLSDGVYAFGVKTETEVETDTEEETETDTDTEVEEETQQEVVTPEVVIPPPTIVTTPTDVPSTLVSILSRLF